MNGNRKTLVGCEFKCFTVGARRVASLRPCEVKAGDAGTAVVERRLHNFERPRRGTVPERAK
jgi:hypothetical protein